VMIVTAKMRIYLLVLLAAIPFDYRLTFKLATVAGPASHLYHV
jgi:hypothetical protein